MTASPEFLTVEDVEQLHDEQLRLFGGLDGVRDRRALEAAVAMPAASFDGQFLHVGLFSMAAAMPSTSRKTSPSSTGTSERHSTPPWRSSV